jgi:SAM-dependent methyltransferase
MPSVDDYLLGTDTTELQRLGIQHRLWSAQAASLWDRAGIGVGSKVLDIGTGPGYAAADLAELVGPTGRVLGIEGSPNYIDAFVDRMGALGLAHAEVRRGDIHHLDTVLTEPEAGAFDAAYCRWVLSFSPDIDRVFARLHAALKPGGRVIIQDYFNWRAMSIAPRDPAFSRVIDAILAYWEGNEGSNDIMGDVPRALRNAGFELVHFEAHQRVAFPGSPLWAWPDSFWPSIVPRVVGAGFLTRGESDAFFERWREASADPDRFMVVPPVFDSIAVRA